MTESTGDNANEEQLLTSIDGEEARLLVHIEPLDPAGEDATDAGQEEEGGPGNSPGLAE